MDSGTRPGVSSPRLCHGGLWVRALVLIGVIASYLLAVFVVAYFLTGGPCAL